MKIKLLNVKIPFSLCFRREVLLGIRLFLRTHPEWRLSPEQFDVEKPDLMANFSSDGMIAFFGSEREGNILKQASFPVVNICSAYNGNDFPRVIIDNLQIGKDAAEYLFHKGYRRFICVGEKSSGMVTKISELRFLGFQNWLNSSKVSVECQFITDPEEFDFLSVKRPFAIFTVNDPLSSSCLYSLTEHGIGVPDDAVLIGTNNDETICETANIPLSSIDVDAKSIGFTAAKLLDDIVKDSSHNTKQVLIPPSGIVERSSTDKFTANNPEVATVRRLISTRCLSSKFQISDLLAEICISRRTLERKFKEETGRSLHSEVKRIRIEQAKDLLEHTNLPISEICLRCGMLDQRRFSRLFKNLVGHNPKDYRQHLSI